MYMEKHLSLNVYRLTNPPRARPGKAGKTRKERENRMKHTSEQTKKLQKLAAVIQLESIHYQQTGKGLVFLELACQNLFDMIKLYKADPTIDN